MSEVAPTSDKKFIRIGSNVLWKIVDPVQYMQKINSYKLTDDYISDVLREAQIRVVTDSTLNELVGKNASLPTFSEVEINYSITTAIKELASPSFPKIGLELVSMKIVVTHPTQGYKVLTKH